VTGKQISLALATIFLLSAGQVLFKFAANHSSKAGDGLLPLLVSPYFAIALFVYAVATVCWMLVLRDVPLRLAYPFAALAFVVVPVMAAAFLGEPLKWTTFAGAALIIIGVWISVR
jgi:undecaprenyl phosphate-alpha-L-ara4N flippase subunit ArnE